MEKITEHPHFFTATNYLWKRLLKPDKYKKIVTESLRFLVSAQRVKVYAFVIMHNHIHLIWQMRENHKRKDEQRDFLKFTGQQIKVDLKKNHPEVLAHFLVNEKDRKFQFWERNSLSIELFTEKFFEQKLDYIHNNPVTAGLSNTPEAYYFSSATFYETQDKHWDFLTHYKE